jgi:hypothetical protein
MLAPKLGGELGGFAGEADSGPASGMAYYFHVLPGDSQVQSGANGLHSGLFGGEPGGQPFRRIGLGKTVFDLIWGEHPSQKSVTKAFHRSRNPGYLSDVNSCAYNHLTAFTSVPSSPNLGGWTTCIS